VSTDFRHGVARCPGCGDELEERSTGACQIDVCPACQGIWIDERDADIDAVIHSALAERETGDLLVIRSTEDLRRDWDRMMAAARHVCARCQGDLSKDDSFRLACARCKGTFVPRVSMPDAKKLLAAEQRSAERMLETEMRTEGRARATRRTYSSAKFAGILVLAIGAILGGLYAAFQLGAAGAIGFIFVCVFMGILWSGGSNPSDPTRESSD